MLKGWESTDPLYVAELNPKSAELSVNKKVVYAEKGLTLLKLTVKSVALPTTLLVVDAVTAR